MDDEFEHTPPHDMRAEQSVLGGMMLDKDAIADVVQMLDTRDFYRPAHQVVFDVIVDLYGRGEPTDATYVAAALTSKGELQRAGGAPYLFELIQSAPPGVNAAWHAGIVRDRATMRRLEQGALRTLQLARTPTDDPEGALAAAQGFLDEVANKRATEDYVRIGDTLSDTLGEVEAVTEYAAKGGSDSLRGVSTGILDLDELTSGYQPGQLIIIAARPSIGKSTLSSDALRATCIRDQQPGIMFSLEMSRTELVTRIISAEAKVNLSKLRAGGMTEDDWVRIERKLPPIMSAPLFIDDSPNMTMPAIRAKARRVQQQHGLSLMVVDYLQLMSGTGKKSENRQQEVAELSRGFKLLAKELQVPVVALSQLNRGPEMRTDKKPMLSDLRDSGGIEQDADVVILIHREDFYDKESPRAGEADLIVAKHRNGPTSTVTCAFQGHYSRFADMATAWSGH